MKTIVELYKDHQGKVSDKWQLYLREYDRLFSPYREQPVSLMEIGIQNGGSLEIWGKYFIHAEKIIGCDINSECHKLKYNDPRIHVVVGDASEDQTAEKIFNQSEKFDLIIDDGSHKSGDIIKAFAKYFPKLNEGGLFIAEDLCCSYWENYQGGLFHPHSSISFFKTLADVVNYEHWGVSLSREELINNFKENYQLDISEGFLDEIHSIEFLNSICIIRKSVKEECFLGARVIAGSQESVVAVNKQLNGLKNSLPEQASNKWSSQEMALAQLYANANRLQKAVVDLQVESANLHQTISVIYGSRSWRYTSFFRASIQVVRFSVRLLRRIRKTARHKGGYINFGRTIVSLMRREGIKGLTARISNNLVKVSEDACVFKL